VIIFSFQETIPPIHFQDRWFYCVIDREKFHAINQQEETDQIKSEGALEAASKAKDICSR